jgi:hypothetical protein
MSLVAGGLGGHTKPNSHGDQQPYDELGRYAGPGEGAWSEKPQEETARGGSLLTTLLGRDGDDFLAGHSGGDVLDKRRAYRPANQGLDHRQPMDSTQREPLPELPDWPSGLELPDWPSKADLPGEPELQKDTSQASEGKPDRLDTKPGVDDSRLDRRITERYGDIRDVLKKYDEKAVITSTYESSEHKPQSLHYKNSAIDLRGNNMPKSKMKQIASALQERLGDDFDVLPEVKIVVNSHGKKEDHSHIHVEYDPKRVR